MYYYYLRILTQVRLQSAGPDGIHGMVLKSCAPSLAKPLTIMFNISFVTGIIPDDWKLASVVPIHKRMKKAQWKTIDLYL